jgi:xanthine dehydrogenase accessory factor
MNALPTKAAAQVATPSAAAALRKTVPSLSSGAWLTALEANWPQAVCRYLQHERAVVRVLVTDLRGSAPREAGACMLVLSSGIVGTIGGGHLEYCAIGLARDLLAAQACAPTTVVTASLPQQQRFVLGPQLGQCCGGVVELWIECFTRDDLPLLRTAADLAATHRPASLTTRCSRTAVQRQVTSVALNATAARCSVRHQDETTTLIERLDTVAQPLWIFGAGHVGQAVVRLCAELPFQITLLDARAELLPEAVPANVQIHPVAAPLTALQSAPANAYFLVFTHDHALDYALCREILLHRPFAWLGLIGSASKGARFRSRLTRECVPTELLARLTCPIGVPGIHSKQPAAIAISVIAQLLQLMHTTPQVAQPTSNASSVHANTAHPNDCEQRCAACPAPRGLL